MVITKWHGTLNSPRKVQSIDWSRIPRHRSEKSIGKCLRIEPLAKEIRT